MKLVDGYPCEKSVDIKYSPYLKKSIYQNTMVVPGGGCAYYRSKKGDACTFCAFPGLTRDVIKGAGYEDYYGSWKLDSETYIKMFDSLFDYSEKSERLAIFNGGSFFPESELPIGFQEYVYNRVSHSKKTKQLLVEAYPNFISRKKLENAVDQLGDKTLMVGIGLESSNDIVRNNIMNKGIDLGRFERKVKMMKEVGVVSYVYVFLKPHLLNEAQAYHDVINTLEYLSSIGVDEIALSCAFVSPGTPLERIYDRGDFRTPWLWTIIKVIEQAKQNRWPVTIGGFDDNPPPKAIPSNCSSCDPIVLDIIESYRRTGEFTMESAPLCSCYPSWEEEMSNDPMIKRIL
ncbi:hypothetical protein [Marinomonas aquiplantarum]|uniref:Radical SAM enzyme (TIGR01210 family) n=1 Tax=Marinomonas aquiplantarum TaxID=491951 RepID=A0A366CXH4_9GAMM|nr:hypothetical protein [Marinomonas aquiplantarum]RBO82541.1 radical SAM enzyme (TIGR01210 family) [Marinomonas aquiplantarum]